MTDQYLICPSCGWVYGPPCDSTRHPDPRAIAVCSKAACAGQILRPATDAEVSALPPLVNINPALSFIAWASEEDVPHELVDGRRVSLGGHTQGQSMLGVGLVCLLAGAAQDNLLCAPKALVASTNGNVRRTEAVLYEGDDVAFACLVIPRRGSKEDRRALEDVLLAPKLQECLFIEWSKTYAEHWLRDRGQWVSKILGADAELHLVTVPVRCRLRDLYER